MLQPMLPPQTMFRPRVLEVCARDVAMPVAIRKALSPPQNHRFLTPVGGPMLHTDIPARGVAQGQCFPPGRGPRPGRVQRASGGCRDTHPPSRRARARPRTARDSWRASLINDNDCDRSTTIAEPSSVGESGQRGRRARSPKLPRKRANTIRYVLMSSEAGQERGHARRHVVPRDDSRVKILGVIPDENRHGIGLRERARLRPGARGRSRRR